MYPNNKTITVIKSIYYLKIRCNFYKNQCDLNEDICGCANSEFEIQRKYLIERIKRIIGSYS